MLGLDVVDDPFEHGVLCPRPVFGSELPTPACFRNLVETTNIIVRETGTMIAIGPLAQSYPHQRNS